MAELARLAGFEHWAFAATRPSGVGDGEYGDAVLSKLPIEEQRVVRFKKWRGRTPRACLLVRVNPPDGANGLPLWFGDHVWNAHTFAICSASTDASAHGQVSHTATPRQARRTCRTISRVMKTGHSSGSWQRSCRTRLVQRAG